VNETNGPDKILTVSPNLNFYVLLDWVSLASLVHVTTFICLHFFCAGFVEEKGLFHFRVKARFRLEMQSIVSS